MDDDMLRLAGSFGSVADAYERGRPSFPREAAAWLVGQEAATVLELGAGTGKLTRELVALGHDVHATDPDPEMLKVLSRHLPDTRVSEAVAEEIPAPDGSVDVVVAAQSFHWFDHDRALPEIARVLRPGGHLALLWNVRNERIPWVRRLGALVGENSQWADDVAQPLVLSELFGFVDEATFTHWQQINRDSIQDLALSLPGVSTLDADARKRKLAEVLAFYDDFGRGMDGMQLPYHARCFRAALTERTDPSGHDQVEQSGEDNDGEPPQQRRDGQSPNDGTDTDMLLIDFR